MAKWSVGAASAMSQRGPAYVAVGQHVYAAGAASQISDQFQAYSVEADAWQVRQAMPSARMRGTLAGSGQALYYFGGMDSSQYACSDIYCHDLPRNSWSRVAGMARMRMLAGAATVDDRIYVIGGVNSEDPGVSSEVEMFQPETGSCSMTDITLGNPRYGACCIGVGDKIYMIGGWHIRDDMELVTAMVEVLDTSLGTVTALTSFPVASSAVYGYYLDGELHCLSGYQFYIYNIEENRWRFGESLSSAYGQRGGMHLVDSTCVVLPYVTDSRVLLGDVRTVEIVNASPAAGFVDEKADNVFRWELKASTAVVQKSALFQWMVQGTSQAFSIYVYGADQWVRVPADTFPDGQTILWRVMASTTEGVESAFSDWYMLTTEDQPHLAPTSLYPSGGTRNATRDIQLSWVVNAPLGTAQTAYEVQVAYDDRLSWQALGGKVSGEAAMHTVQGGTLEPGEDSRVFWRVRTYNTDDQAGEWSEPVSFLALLAPQPPQWIGVESGRARPLCRWLAAGQAAWQVQVLRGDEVVHDAGERPGTDNSYRIAVYLAPGPYTFRARVQNALQLWSEWAPYEALVNFEQNLVVTLEGQAVLGGAQLRFDVGVK